MRCTAEPQLRQSRRNASRNQLPGTASSATLDRSPFPVHCAESQAGRMLSSPHDSLPSSVAQPLVLLVEDDPDSRVMCAAGLQGAGFLVLRVGVGSWSATQGMAVIAQVVARAFQ